MGFRKWPLVLGAATLAALVAWDWKGAGSCFAGQNDLGSVWRVRETDWECTWVRRGRSDTFDGRWTSVRNGREVTDVVRLESVRGDQVVLYREGTRGRYYGTLSRDRRRVVDGRADWYKSGGSWSAVIEDDQPPPRPDFDLGRVWRVTEGAFEGVWTRRGRSKNFDAVWYDRKSRKQVRDVVRLESLEGRDVVLYREGTRGRYYGRLSRDRQRVENGRADWYGPGGSWSAVIEY